MSNFLSSVIPDLGCKPIYFDGGFGTQLQLRGLAQGVSPGLWNIENPAAVKDAHRAYMDAGTDIITTNTFTAHRWFLGDKAAAATAAGVKLAREVARETGHGIVGLDVGPTGHMIAPLGNLAFEDAVAGYTEMIAAGVAEHPDFIVLETFTDAYEAKAAVLAAQSCSDLPILVSFSFGDNGRLLTGLEARGVAAMFEGLGVSAIGANCGMGPDGMTGVIRALAHSTRLPIFANPNAGLPEMLNGQAVYHLSPEDYAPLAAALFSEGAWMVGGCCGTGPDHIRALRSASQTAALLPRPESVPAVVTSASRTFSLSDITNISDALNADANPRFNNILGTIVDSCAADHDAEDSAADEAVDLAFDAQDEGADALRLNLAGVVPPQFYRTLIPRLQSVVPLPLLFSDKETAALTLAHRVYNGQPITKDSLQKGSD